MDETVRNHRDVAIYMYCPPRGISFSLKRTMITQARRAWAQSDETARNGRSIRPSSSVLLHHLVDAFAVRADRRAGLGRARHREHFAAQRHDMGAHDGTFGDLVLLHVVEEFGSIAVGRLVGG